MLLIHSADKTTISQCYCIFELYNYEFATCSLTWLPGKRLSLQLQTCMMLLGILPELSVPFHW